MAFGKVIAMLVLISSVVLGAWYFVLRSEMSSDVNVPEGPILSSAKANDPLGMTRTDSAGNKSVKGASAEEPRKSLPVNSDSNSTDSVREKFYSARSAAEALEQVDVLYLNGEDKLANQLEALVAAMCKPNRPSVSNPRQRWVVDHLDNYCGVTSYTRENQKELVENYFRSYQADLTAAHATLDGLTGEERSEAIRQMIANANSWHDLEVVKALIAVYPTEARSEDAVYDLGQDPRFVGQLGRDVQLGALTLMQCELYASGCAPGSIRTMDTCISTGLCEANWSMLDFYTNTLSAVQIEQLQQVLAYLLEVAGSPP
jgi:hypothetical protein